MGSHHFAESEKSVNRENSPWFRVIFAPAKIELGEAKEVLAKSRTDKAINLQGFCFFATFFSKKKVGKSPRNPQAFKKISEFFGDFCVLCGFAD